MVAQYIELGNRSWSVLIYYNVREEDFDEIEDSLYQLGCPEEEIDTALDNLSNQNTGLTYTNERKRMSIVCIGAVSNKAQFLNTVAHEMKHVQSHICDYYNVDEDSEEAAYLTGYLFQQMYRAVAKFLKYGRL